MLANTNPKLFSFFSGAGFLDLGFEAEGFRVSFVNEFHPPFMAAYQYSRRLLGIAPPEFGYSTESITSFSEGRLRTELQDWVAAAKRDGSLLGFIGGPPCPDFSVGGKNRGRHGERGKLSGTYVSLICSLQPDFFIFENVKGLWSTKRHRAFYNELKAQLRVAQYQVADKLINCIQYGAPQDRERVILFGVHNRLLREPDAIREDNSFPWDKYAEFPSQSAFEHAWPTTSPYTEASFIPCPPGIPKRLTVQYWFDLNQVDAHANAAHCFQPRAGLARFRTVQEGDDSRKSFKRLHRWRYSPTACYGNNEVHLHPYKPRRISVAEALAIQSLPREFELPASMTLSDMFKTVGNGVPYIAARKLARTVMEYLERPYAIDCREHRPLDWQPASHPMLQLC